MQLSKNYVEGISSPLNEQCPNDHVDIRNLVRCEIEAQLKGNQWPPSNFAPFINKPSTPNYTEDLSFEEIRMMYYESNASFIQSAQALAKTIRDAENKMEVLMSMNRDVLEKLTSIYNNTGAAKETKKMQDSLISQSSLGESYKNKVVGTLNFQNLNAQPPFSAYEPMFTIPQQNKDQQLNFNSFGQHLQQGKQGVFYMPKQQNEPNFKILSSVIPQEQKEQSLGHHQPPKTHPFCFIDESPRTRPLYNICKTQQEKALEQNEPRAESGKRQVPETTPSISGIAKAQEQKKTNFEFVTDREYRKQSRCLIKSPGFSNYHTSRQKQNKPISISAFSPQPQEDFEHSSDSEDDTARVDTVMLQEYDIEVDTVEPLLIIKPKDTQTSEATENDLQDRIDPAELSVQIHNIKKGFEGSIVIECGNEESVKTLEAEVVKKFALDYYVEMLHPDKDPQIVITGIDNQINDKKLVEIIRKQNKLNGKINLVESFDTVKSPFNHSAVIEVNKKLYKEIMKQETPGFYIGWNRCLVRDVFHIRRCFNCWGFDHTENNCQKCVSENDWDEGQYE